MSLKILLADDSMTAQNMGKKILSEAGYDVLTVSNGAAAMKKLTAGQFDLLLLDVVMPGYSGPEICEKLRALKNYAKVPILLTIGKMEMGEFKVEDATKLKADGVIIKPFEASDLITAVQKLAAAAPEPAPPKPATPPEAEKTVKLKPIAEEGDESYKQWSANAPEHAGEAHEAPPAPPAMTPEVAATAAFDAVETGGSPAFDVTSAAPAFDLNSSAYESGPSGRNSDVAAELGLGGAAAAAAPSAEIPLEAAPAPASTTAPELERPAEVHVGPVAPAPDIEFTSAAPVDVHVEALPDFEPESRDDSTPVVADPNFLSDRSQMVSDFATKFSTADDDDVPVGVAGAEAAAPEATAEVHAVQPPSPTVPHPAEIGEETAKMSPWVSEAEKEPEPPAVHEEPAPVAAAPEPPAPVVEAAPEPPAPPVEVAAAPAPPAPEPPPTKPAGDLEFAQALQAAIANAPVADAEPEPPAPEAPAPAPKQEQVAAAAAAAAAAVPELAGVDPNIVQRAVERVLSNAKQDIIAEILKELKK